MERKRISFLVLVAAICIATTPFGGLKIAGRGISLYLYALFAVAGVHGIYKDKGKLFIETLQWVFIVVLIFFIVSYQWTPPHSGNATVEGDYSTFIKGAIFILILMLFIYGKEDKELFQFCALIGTVAMAFYMIFNSAGTYALQFSNRITLAIGDSVTEVNYLCFLLIMPTGYAVSKVLDADVNKLLKLIFGISILLVLYILLFTGSRAGILAIIATAFFATILSLFGNGKLQGRSFIALFALGIVVLVIVPTIYDQLPETIVRRISIQNFLLATSGANGRVDIWKRAFEAMGREENILLLIFGHGFLSSEVTFGITLHNLFIQVLYEQGVVGLGLVVYLFYKVLRDSIKDKNVIVISETIGTLILCMSLAGVISRFFWICLAMLILCSRPEENTEAAIYE